MSISSDPGRARVRAGLASVESSLRRHRPSAAFTALVLAAWRTRAKRAAAAVGAGIGVKVALAVALAATATAAVALHVHETKKRSAPMVATAALAPTLERAGVVHRFAGCLERRSSSRAPDAVH